MNVHKCRTAEKNCRNDIVTLAMITGRDCLMRVASRQHVRPELSRFATGAGNKILHATSATRGCRVQPLFQPCRCSKLYVRTYATLGCPASSVAVAQACMSDFDS